MSGYQILARGFVQTEPFQFLENYPRVRRAMPALAGGAVGALVGGAHPVLSALLGSTIVRNAVDLASGDITAEQAARRVGSHAVATVGALSAPVAPMAGYGAGVILGNILFGVDAPSLDAVREGRSTLHRGMKGESVTWVQSLIMPPSDIDGDFGSDTEEAVKVFQKKVMIDQTGIVNRATLAGLDQLAAAGGEPLWRRTARAGTPAPKAKAPIQATAKVEPVRPSSPSSSPSWSSSAPSQTSTDIVPQTQTQPAQQESFLNKPLYKGSKLTVLQGGLIGLCGAALLGAAVSIAIPSPSAP